MPAEGSTWTGKATIDDKGNPIAGSIGHEVTKAIEAATGFATRLTVLGYTQRGGSAHAQRIACSRTRFGVAAIDAITSGERGKFTALRGDTVVLEPFEIMMGKTKWVPEELLATARDL